MRVHLPSTARRIAFLGSPNFELHVPLAADWAHVRFFPVTRGWTEAIEAAAAWSAEICIVFAPQELSPDEVTRLPGLTIGVLPTPLSIPALEALAAREQAQARGFRWFTRVDGPFPRAGVSLPFLQSLPLPVDTRRFARGPLLDRKTVLVPEWAAPPPDVLEHVRKLASVEILRGTADTDATLEALERNGVLLYAARDLLGRFDALPQVALASGLLLISETPFPGDWYVEAEDDFIVRPRWELLGAVDEFIRMPELFKAVRIRGWQKMQEAFDASSGFKRLVHDAELFADPRAHLARAGEQVAPMPSNVTRIGSRKAAVGS